MVTGWRSRTLLVAILLLGALTSAGAGNREQSPDPAAYGECLEQMAVARADEGGYGAIFQSPDSQRCCCIDFAGNLCCIRRDKEYGCISLRQYCFCRPPRPRPSD